MNSRPAGDVDNSVPAAPPQVRDAANLLWASLGLFVLNAALHRDRYLTGEAPIGFLAIVGLCSIALWAWLTINIFRGRNWARITALVLALLGVPRLLVSIRNHFGDLTLADALGVITALMQYAALWLVFADPGRLWFRSRKRE